MGPRAVKPFRDAAPGGARAWSAPSGISVATLTVEGEVFAVFEWCATPPPQLARLTAAERHVLEQLRAGASNRAIARARGSSVRTVANQVASLLRKLGAGSRFELIQRLGPGDVAARSRT